MKITSSVLTIAIAFLASGAAWAGPLEDAIRASDYDAATAAIEAGEDVTGTTEGGTPLIILAASQSENDIVDMLLNAGADANALTEGDATALMYAAGANNYILADRLIEAGADVNLRDSQGDPAVNWGAYYGSLEYILALLEAGADTSLRGHGNGYEIALRRGHEETVQALAEHDGLLRDAPDAGFDSIGRPLLHEAARTGDAEALTALLASGTDVDIPDTIDFTALMHAARDGQSEAVHSLLDAGADVNHKAHAYGLELTPLHLAAISNQADIVDTLVANGADLNAQGSTGQAPFGWALFEGGHEAALALLQAGADWTVGPDDGPDLRGIAEARGWDDVLALMGD